MTSFIQKLGLGLKKSSQKISNGLSDIFTKKKLSSDTLDDLSDVLLSADMGTTSTQKIIDSLAKKRLNKDLTIAEIKQALAEEVAFLLAK